MGAHLKSVHGTEEALKAFPPYGGGRVPSVLDERQRLAVHLGVFGNAPETIDCILELDRETYE